MKKIAIVTISWGSNYGNKLQNYAMQETYKQFGFEVETIKFLPTIKRKKQSRFKKITLRKIINKVYNTIHKKKIVYINNERNKCFNEFNKNIKFTKQYTENNYKQLPAEFDYYSVGSDQVWNAFFPDYSDYYLIDFIDSKNKIAYSPSLGTSEIPKNKRELFKSSLSKFKNISCREEQGAEILTKLLNKKVDVLIDPTMLLTAEDWKKIAKMPKQFNGKKYVLCYFLGLNDNNRKKIIKKYAKANDLDIINILDPKSDFYGTGPSEFLYLEQNAEIIFTDSFHSSVFALIFNKPFIVFRRNDEYKNMDSRLDTLINKFKLTGRKFDGKSITKENLEHDYTKAYKILDKERQKSKEFLEKALDIK